jgi:hypothetical protein
MARSFSEKCEWAKKAAELDLDSEKGYFAIGEIAKESRLGRQRLTYYANAYEAAGESGIRALTYRKKTPDSVREEATKRVQDYLANRVDHQFRNEMGFLIDARGNHIIVSEKRPYDSNSHEASCIESFRVRYTDYDNRWHLYWMRKFGQWWPYVPRQPVYTIDDCIREVKEDAFGCFWG